MSPIKIHTSPMRRAAFERDQGICATCGADCRKIKRIYWRYLDEDAQMFYGDLVRFNDKVFWEADHVIERADGGQDVIENIQTLCRPCHVIKTKLARRERLARESFKRLTGEEILVMVESIGGGLTLGGPTGLWRRGIFEEEVCELITHNRQEVIRALMKRPTQEVPCSYQLFLEYVS